MQGFNMGRYVPPDLEGTVSFNAASGKGHALGSRARKLKSEGILTVRFECPFAIWCTTCQPEQIIGQGVRFNAEKKKVGNYYSTAIWSFRFKHTVCGGWIEVRTDPQNAEYVVVEGGRRRDTGQDKLLDGEIRIGVSEEEKARLEKDGGFGMLEKKVEDKSVFTTQQKRLDQLVRASERDWADPYEKSQLLRRDFRAGRRIRQENEKSGEALKDKYGLGVEMLEQQPEDAERAKLIEYGETLETTSVAKPMFEVRTSAPTSKANQGSGRTARKATAAELAEQKKSKLQKTLNTNTRTALDPFLRKDQIWQSRAKRKRVEEEQETKDTTVTKLPSMALVGYDSD